MQAQLDLRSCRVSRATVIEPPRYGAADVNRDFSAPVRGYRLGRNLLWNLAGTAAPMLAALVCIPILVHALGAQRFGVLAIAWALIGGFGLLDFASIALTKLIAERIGNGHSEQIPPLFWIGVLLTLASSAVLAGVFAAACPFLVRHILKVPMALRLDTLNAFYLIAVAIPAVTLGKVFRGVLASLQRFDLVNYVRIPLSVLTFLGPVMVLPFTHSLVWAVAAIASAWIVSSLVQLIICFQVIPCLASGPFFRLSLVPTLLSFGGWMTVFNITVPLMVYVDRFVIGAMISMSAVAWYATPHEFVTKLSIVSAAGAGVLLPALAESVEGDPGSIAGLVDWGMKYTILAMFPITLVIETFARDGLDLWLGHGFALHAAVALQWLGVGVFFNAMAAVPMMLILAVHRPDIPAKLHLVEAPLYLAVLYCLTYAYGINGVAAAAAMMFACDGLVWFAFARALVPAGAEPLRRSLWAMAASLPVFALAVMLPDMPAVKLAFLCLALGIFALWAFCTLPLGVYGADRESAQAST